MRPSRSVRQTTFRVRRSFTQTRRPLRSTNKTSSLQFSQNRETRVAHKTTAKITARREKSEWSALEKPVAPLTESAVRRIIRVSVLWSWRRDSNPRPSDYKSDALPTELRQQFWGIPALPRKRIPRIPSECPGQLVKLSQGQLGVQAKAVHPRLQHHQHKSPAEPAALSRRTKAHADRQKAQKASIGALVCRCSIGRPAGGECLRTSRSRLQPSRNDATPASLLPRQQGIDR